ncbi:MAG: hypothetical protein J0L92_03745 [Deltaproteobacteria bacterium]|nr:hypothetical protein [Deltaproteobacteria bacterium]
MSSRSEREAVVADVVVSARTTGKFALPPSVDADLLAAADRADLWSLLDGPEPEFRAWLGTTGRHGARLAWGNDPPVRAGLSALLVDVVLGGGGRRAAAPKTKNDAAKKGNATPAVVAQVLTATTAIAHPDASVVDRAHEHARLVHGGHSAEIVFPSARELPLHLRGGVPTLHVEAFERLVSGDARLDSVTATRLILLLAERTWEATAAGDQSWVVRTVGWRGLAQMVGAGAANNPTDLRRVAYELDRVRLCLGDASVSLVTIEWDSRLRVDLRVGPPLRPGFVTEFGRQARDTRYLVPLPRVAMLPPPSSTNPRLHAGELRLHLLLLREVRMRAEELHQRGSVHVPLDTRRLLADEAGLPASGSEQAWAGWLRSGHVVERDADRYDLGPAYATQREAIIAGAQQSSSGRARRGRRRSAQS